VHDPAGSSSALAVLDGCNEGHYGPGDSWVPCRCRGFLWVDPAGASGGYSAPPRSPAP
jgi:hypothetical protein